MLLKVTFIFSVYFVGYSFSKVSDCQRCYTNHIRLPVPFFQDGHIYSLSPLDNGFLKFNKGENVLFICPGANNYLNISIPTKKTNTKYLRVNATCMGDNKVNIQNIQYNINNIFCNKTVRADILMKSAPNQRWPLCGIYQIGYNVTTHVWIPLITICYNSSNGTLYTQHIINASTLNVNSPKIKHLSTFQQAGLDTTIPISISYNKTIQRIRFSSHLKSSQLATNYINNASYFVRGHLTPHADFAMASSQVSTYYIMNTAPTWNSVNSGNWKSVEITVRKLSNQYGPLDISTGTFQILRYPNKYGVLTDIYLSENQIPVPKYIWKIVYHRERREAIVFVILNDPFAKNPEFCRDICQENGFFNAGWTNIAKGRVWCCEYQDFKNNVSFAPRPSVKKSKYSVLRFMRT